MATDRDAPVPIEVTVTCASVEEAHAVMRAVVDARLAACGQTWPISSCYRWRDEINDDEEHLVLIKTTSPHFDAVCDVIRANHSYELPAIVAVAVTSTGPDYIDWLIDCTRSP